MCVSAVHVPDHSTDGTDSSTDSSCLKTIFSDKSSPRHIALIKVLGFHGGGGGGSRTLEGHGRSNRQ